MTALTFPPTPATNDVFTSGEKSWVWTGQVWDPIPGENLGSFYGFKYIPQTGELILDIINDGVTEVLLPDQNKRPTDYREWVFTSRNMEFSWNDANLIVRVD